MNFVALQMLIGDRAKYLGLIFAVAFSTFLMSQQSSIFVGVMDRTTSQIKDVKDAAIWVMDPKTQYFDESKALDDNAVYRVRSVSGVEWAVGLFKGLPRARAMDGNFRVVTMIGVDDASLVGAPRDIVLGTVDALRAPDAVLVDRVGYEFFFPNQPYALGNTLELNDHRVSIQGIVNSSAPFQNLPVFYARYRQAVTYVGAERNQLSFVLVKGKPGLSDDEVCRRIQAVTGLHAVTGREFGWQTIRYYFAHTGIPLNFAITITIGLIVGAIVAGQTFYIFTLENLKHFGALKAIGVTNWGITRMILLQASMVSAIGYSIGIALTAGFFEMTKSNLDMRGFLVPWQIAVFTAAVVIVIVIAASLASIRRVLVLEPAAVFRG